MNLHSVLSLCGGLAFFLFGMSLLSQGLEKLAGGRLEGLLRKLTSNPVKSLFLGAAITIAIQSSSALTVMLVGLVNSGIMEISQTVGVIMGSNIGTTLTAWILSLSGLKSSNILISMLKPENFSPLVALIGVIFIMSGKTQKKKDIGVIMAGFSVLMYGMELMSGAVAPLADMPEFAQILVAFKNPILGVLIGTVFTGIIQSSAASVGILQALALTGSISVGMAIPIIMGQNIGTCVTALLSSIGVNKNAKKVSVIHVCFNMIGTILGLIVFFMVSQILNLPVLHEKATPFTIAGFHSLFNIVTTLVLLPMSAVLVRIANAVYPEKPDDGQEAPAVLLDPRLLVAPGLAVRKSYEKTVEMAVVAQAAFKRAMQIMERYDDESFAAIEEAESRLDWMEDGINRYLILLSEKAMNAEDSNLVNEMFHVITDYERISDYAMDLAHAARKRNKKEMIFSSFAEDEVVVLNAAMHDLLDRMVRAYADNDKEQALFVEPLCDVVEDLIQDVRKRHIKRMRSKICDGETGIFLEDYLTGCDRVAAHCSNASISIIQNYDQNYEEHSASKEEKYSDAGYQRLVEEFRKKYILPERDAEAEKEEKRRRKLLKQTKSAGEAQPPVTEGNWIGNA